MMIKTKYQTIETSLESYFKNLEGGMIGERQQQVLDKIRDIPKMTALEYAELCFHTSNSNFVRPRITELKEMGKIKPAGKRQCTISKRNAFVWEVVG